MAENFAKLMTDYQTTDTHIHTKMLRITSLFSSYFISHVILLQVP